MIAAGLAAPARACLAVLAILAFGAAELQLLHAKKVEEVARVSLNSHTMAGERYGW
jgi:hypothetical protein